MILIRYVAPGQSGEWHCEDTASSQQQSGVKRKKKNCLFEGALLWTINAKRMMPCEKRKNRDLGGDANYPPHPVWSCLVLVMLCECVNCSCASKLGEFSPL